MHRPTLSELRAAHDKNVPDLIRPGLEVLFSGINPSLYSAAVGHHFARPGNRFWKTLHMASFTPRLIQPDEEQELLALGFGITNLVPRATASASELCDDEYLHGARRLARKLKRYRPKVVAFVGISAYRVVSSNPNAKVGPQPKPFAATRTWVLPNPSGLNAHYQLPELAKIYAELARELRNASRR
jgi:TDG/mug DNA glycosylase family protein